jgi:hypothetical protein
MQRINLLREMREKVIQEESKGSWSPSEKSKKSQMDSSGGNKSTLIEK